MPLILDGDSRSFRAAAYGRPSERKISFLRQQFEDPSRALRFADQSFFERSRQIFEDNFSASALAKIEAVRRNLSGVWDLDEIQYLDSVEKLQNARPVMQRWIMANPFIRGLYKQGRVVGYGESYLDHAKQGVGADHYDYRLVMSGMAEYNDEDGWTATTYFDELLDEDEEPTFNEKIDIFRTWCEAEYALHTGKRDITSPEDNEWG